MVALVFDSAINILFVTLLVSAIAFLVLILFYYVSVVVDSRDFKNGNRGERKIDLIVAHNNECIKKRDGLEKLEIKNKQ